MTVRTQEPHDPDDVRRKILDCALTLAASAGWTDSMLQQAAKKAAVPDGHDKLSFPKGVQDLIHFYSQEIDMRLLRALDGTDLDAMRVRERISFAVRTRIELLSPHKDVAKRIAAYLALPQNVILASQLIYGTCDAIWHGIGDRSTDINFYTKRATLAGVYSSTLLYWLGDESDGAQKSWDFLSRRIDNVMEFETIKARVRTTFDKLPSPWSVLGALRYGIKR